MVGIVMYLSVIIIDSTSISMITSYVLDTMLGTGGEAGAKQTKNVQVPLWSLHSKDSLLFVCLFV